MKRVHRGFLRKYYQNKHELGSLLSELEERLPRTTVGRSFYCADRQLLTLFRQTVIYIDCFKYK